MRTEHATRFGRSTARRAVTLVHTVTSMGTVVMLVTTVMVPALIGLRDRNRQALCATRIGLMTRAMLTYAMDFDETPPFVGIGSEDCGTNHTFDGKPTWDFWAANESWLLPGGLQGWALSGAWQTPQINWNPYCKVENGTLFPYTRFTEIYRCPEFEAIPNKDQNAFNYTRTVLGRKFVSSFLGDPGASTIGLGSIVRLSAIHAPSRMYLLLDEQWDFHCGAVAEDTGTINTRGYWMRMDPMHGLLGDMVGSYHGSMSKVIRNPYLLSSKSGCVSHYDGHVGLMRDPFPWRTATTTDLLTLLNVLMSDPDGKRIYTDPLLQPLYAQRGLAIPFEQLIAMLL